MANARTIAVIAVAAIAFWCIYAAINFPKIKIEEDKEVPVETVTNILNFNTTFALFVTSLIK